MTLSAVLCNHGCVVRNTVIPAKNETQKAAMIILKLGTLDRAWGGSSHPILWAVI